MVGGGNSQGRAGHFPALVKTDTGYVVEASVPLKTDVWDIVPEHLGVLGFQSHLNGSSGPRRDTKLIWSAADIQDQSWSNPSLYGKLIFWDHYEVGIAPAQQKRVACPSPGVAGAGEILSPGPGRERESACLHVVWRLPRR